MDKKQFDKNKGFVRDDALDVEFKTPQVLVIGAGSNSRQEESTANHFFG
ncbi:MAG: hypothetical protein J6I84_03375 [Bacilli bacterium]|nr:hypothetical protein [Bacilli bacterium]